MGNKVVVKGKTKAVAKKTPIKAGSTHYGKNTGGIASRKITMTVKALKNKKKK